MPKMGKKYTLGIIPHFREIDAVLNAPTLSTLSNEIVIIDPTQPIEAVLEKICSCKSIISSSLHGIIASHAYGVNCAWVRFEPEWNRKIEGDDIKFADHYSAVNLDDKIQTPKYVSFKEDSITSLVIYAENAPVPDPTNLMDGLESNCPFR